MGLEKYDFQLFLTDIHVCMVVSWVSTKKKLRSQVCVTHNKHEMPTFHNHAGKNSILHTLPEDEIEEGRRDIYEWSMKRSSKRRGLRGTLYRLKKLFIDKSIIKSFLLNLTPIIILQMALAGLFTFACQKWGLSFDVQMTMLVSPIIFPLAFSINADFQRREKVLEDLALFKGALMILFFSHRDWYPSTGLSQGFLKAVTNKLKGLIVNIKEYLLTEKEKRRNFILKVIYEDFSDIAQLNDEVRASNLPSNSPLVTRLLHYHNLMCWAFERLRVVREYRSPRTIRSFTKVFISLMPLLLSPYYVFIGKHAGNHWAAYYVAVIVSFVFGTLQGVQDKLDDPFDGISEDDINLGQLEDWTLQSLLTNRTVTIGRFTVTTSLPETTTTEVSETATAHGTLKQSERKRGSSFKNDVKRIPSILKRPHRRESVQVPRNNSDPNSYKANLENINPEVVHRLQTLTDKGLTGSTTILPGYHMKEKPVVLPLNSSDASLSTNPETMSVTQGLPKVQLLHQKKNDFKKAVSFVGGPPSPVEELSDEYNSTDEFPEKKNPLQWIIGSGSGTNSNSSTVNLDDLPDGLRRVLQELGKASGTDFVYHGEPKLPVEPSSGTPASLSGLFEGPLAGTKTCTSNPNSCLQGDLNSSTVRSPEKLVSANKDVFDHYDGCHDNIVTTQHTGKAAEDDLNVPLTSENQFSDNVTRQKGKQSPKRKLSVNSNRVSPLADRLSNTANVSQLASPSSIHETPSAGSGQQSAVTTIAESSVLPHSSSPGSLLVDIKPDSSHPTALLPSLGTVVSSTPSKYGVYAGPSPDVSPLATPAPTHSLSPLVASSHDGKASYVNCQHTSSQESLPQDNEVTIPNSGVDLPTSLRSRFNVSRSPTLSETRDAESHSSSSPPDTALSSIKPAGSTFSSPPSRFSVTRSRTPLPSPLLPSKSSDHRTDSVLTPSPSGNLSSLSGESNISSRFNVKAVPSPSSQLDIQDDPSDASGLHYIDLKLKEEVSSEGNTPDIDQKGSRLSEGQLCRDESFDSDYSPEHVDTLNLLKGDRRSTSSSDDAPPSERKPMVKKTSQRLVLSDIEKPEVFI